MDRDMGQKTQDESRALLNQSGSLETSTKNTAVETDLTSSDICFLATSKSGLGHLRRSATIAQAVKARAPGRGLHLISNAPLVGLTRADLAAFDSIGVHERPEMAKGAARTGAGVLVLDTITVPGVESLGLPLALVLRETPDNQVHRFQLAAGRHWDMVIVANPPDHWMPQAGALRARAVAAVGWIYRPTGPRQKVVAGQPTILIATGGGGTSETAAALFAGIDSVLANVRQRATLPFNVIQAIGPRAKGFGQVAQVDRTVDPGSALNELFGVADIVISTAGYNSVLELATTDTPALLVPIPRSIDDQAARARLWGPLLGAWHDENAPEVACDWLGQQIATPARRPSIDLGPSGEGLAADAILRLG
jgi:predicted glycosyltransferase